MEWMNQLGGLLQQYTGANNNDQTPDTVHDDFDQFAQAAPQSTLASGLADVFRSNQTPPFGNMLGQLFGQSNGQQRASILNTLIAVAGPAVLSQVLNRQSNNMGGGGGLSGLLGGLMGGQQTTVTPEQAEQIPPEAVQEIAAQAEQRDPSIIDRMSDIYAQHPTLIKTLGAAALAVLMARVARDHSGLNL